MALSNPKFYEEIKNYALRAIRERPRLQTHLLADFHRAVNAGEVEGIPIASRIDANDNSYGIIKLLVSRGYFTFKEREKMKLTQKGRAYLKVKETPYEPKGDTMNGQTIVLVTFSGYEKEYAYFSDSELEVGDLVVVAPNNEFKVAEVTKTQGLYQSQADRATKWIVQRVDTEAFYAREKRMALVQEVRNKLKQRKDQLDEIILYQQLAGKDPEIKALLDQLNELDPTTQIVLPSGGTVEQIEQEKTDGDS